MNCLRLGRAVFAGFVLSVIFAASAHAATFTVDSTGDESAVDPSTACDTALNTCTLRSAIEAANAQAGADVIEFSISGDGVHTFTPASAYPVISDAVTIDGSTQPGASTCTNNALVPAGLPAASNTPYTLQIEVDGTSGSPFNGGLLTLGGGSSGSVLRGLVINRASNFSSGVRIEGGITGATLECNYIGTDATGTSALANVASGVMIETVTGVTVQNNLISGNTGSGIFTTGSDNTTIQNNIIGLDVNGTSALANNNGINGNGYGATAGYGLTHNVISGNTDFGVSFSNTFDIAITGNLIGLTMNGDALGNGGDGIVIFGSSEVAIGGTPVANRNVVASNHGSGINLYEDCNGSGSVQRVIIIGNYVGTNTSGSVAAGFGNQESGININEYHGSCGTVYKNIIGGDNAGEPNTIAGNTQDGIRAYQSQQGDVFSNVFLPNIIHSNGNLGVNLAFDSLDNGIADTDLGPNVINNFLMSYPAIHANYYINHPTINSTSFSGNQITVNYSYQANGVEDNFPSIQASNLVGYRLDFYINNAGQDGAYLGYSQAKTHLGSFIVNGSEINATHVFTSPVTPTDGQVITVTATVLWQNIPDPGTNCQDDQWGDGPPYHVTCVNK
jgi:CSLREA domain-containing protein